VNGRTPYFWFRLGMGLLLLVGLLSIPMLHWQLPADATPTAWVIKPLVTHTPTLTTTPGWWQTPLVTIPTASPQATGTLTDTRHLSPFKDDSEKGTPSMETPDATLP
jgi:hypothetical protein